MSDNNELNVFMEDMLKRWNLDKLPGCCTLIEPLRIASSTEYEFSVVYPVLEKYLNPLNSMQGGLITAAFDNTFGGLVVHALKKPAASININTTYHKPIYADDELLVKVEIKSAGSSIVYMTGEGRNRNGDLIASATSNLKIL